MLIHSLKEDWSGNKAQEGYSLFLLNQTHKSQHLRLAKLNNKIGLYFGISDLCPKKFQE